MNEVLDAKLLSRHSRIDHAKNLLNQTKTLFERFGSSELKAAHARFAELLEAMNADELRLVVVGEYSRGKSSLANALLGIKLLPTAQEATTAINTFIRQLPAGRPHPYLLIHFCDDRPTQEIAWADDKVLERWGTELDRQNAEIRKSVKMIEAYTDHQLLKLGLCVVDTPGLQSIMAHHETITRRAIAQSHVALWVQSASQLGGTMTEWAFVSSTIRSNFRKFLTVVNMWDMVLDPSDEEGRRTVPAEYAERKMEVVRNNFRTSFQHLRPDEVDLLIDDRHLMGVSAKWALEEKGERHQRSGIEALSVRLGDMLASGEAMEEIYSKPLKQLLNIQSKLAGHVAEELVQLESSATLADRKREIERLTKEIEQLERQLDQENSDSAGEHARALEDFRERIRTDLVEPLVDLKLLVEDSVTDSYVDEQVSANRDRLTLPPEVESAMQQVGDKVAERWRGLQSDVGDNLTGLRASYLGKMERHASQIEGRIGAMKLSLPAIDAQVDIDFGALQEHRQRESEIEQKLEEAEKTIDDLEGDLARLPEGTDPRWVRAIAERDSLVRRLDALGPPPLPTLRKDRIKTSDWGSGFLWLSATYEVIEVTDDSNERRHRAAVDKIDAEIREKEAALHKIAGDEANSNERRQLLKFQVKKHQKETQKLLKDAERVRRAADEKRTSIVRSAKNKMLATTQRRIDETINFLTTRVMAAIEAAFEEQRRLLEHCVAENLMEPLNAKRAQRQAVQELLQQGQAALERRRMDLAEAERTLEALIAETQAAMNP